MGLDVDIVKDYNHLPADLKISGLSAPESGNHLVWRPVIGHDLNVWFNIPLEETGIFRLNWRWFDTVKKQSHIISLDGSVISTRPYDERDYQLVRLAPGRHLLNIRFFKVRAPTADGDDRPISAALESLRIQTYIATPTPAENAAALLLLTVLLYLLYTVIFRRQKSFDAANT